MGPRIDWSEWSTFIFLPWAPVWLVRELLVIVPLFKIFIICSSCILYSSLSLLYSLKFCIQDKKLTCLPLSWPWYGSYIWVAIQVGDLSHLGRNELWKVIYFLQLKSIQDFCMWHWNKKTGLKSHWSSNGSRSFHRIP